jgi:hypothetical protein
MPAALCALTAMLCLLAPGPAGEDIYTWTDAEGTAHYTNDPNTIPRRYRDKAHALDGAPLPADAPDKAAPPVEASKSPPESAAKPIPPKAPERTEEPLEESAPPPSPLPPSGTAGLDETAWRRLFQRTTERVRRAELALARDKQSLDKVSNEESYMVVDPYGRVMTAGRATSLRMQLSEDERLVHEAREALYDLERAAAREAVPLEWRR